MAALRFHFELSRVRAAIAPLASLALLAVVALGCGQPDPNRINDRLPPAEPIVTYCVGLPAEGLVLTDASGTTRPIESYRGRILVLEFWSCRCPHVERTEQARKRFIARYGPRGVAYAAIDSNRDEYPEEIERYLADHGSSYTVFLDQESTVARRFNATRTPEVFVLDRHGVVRYAGSPLGTHQWSAEKPERLDQLEQAVEALLNGRQPQPARCPPLGCRIRKQSRWW